MIPEAAVEAAARAMYAGDWDALHSPAKNVRLSIFRKALEAAAPHMLARGWDEGRTHGATYPYGERGLATDDNPYRTAK